MSSPEFILSLSASDLYAAPAVPPSCRGSCILVTRPIFGRCPAQTRTRVLGRARSERLSCVQLRQARHVQISLLHPSSDDADNQPSQKLSGKEKTDELNQS
jgi:hypothetical protein